MHAGAAQHTERDGRAVTGRLVRARRRFRFAPVVMVAAAVSASASGGEPVTVIVDMDAQAPGVQATVTVTTGTTTVSDIAVYVVDPRQSRTMWAIGYFGGLDRGIAFGHMPSASNTGCVTDAVGTPGVPVNPGNSGWVDHPPGFDPGFVGPEVQYMESGATAPAVISAQPAGPIFTLDVTLNDAAPGDRFEFHLLDFVRVWASGSTAGAFSTRGPLTLDTGGDAVADDTNTIYGIDPDPPIPTPTAAFLVDYVDGPAAIVVVPAPGDLDGDGSIGFADLSDLLSHWGACSACPQDLDGNGTVGFAELDLLLGNWGGAATPGC